MKATCRSLLPALAILLAAAPFGCIPSEPMPPGQMDDLWRPTSPAWGRAELEPVKVAEGKRYSRIEIVYEPSPIWGIIALHELAQELPEGDTLRVPLSEQHAKATAALMRRLGQSVQAMAAAASDASDDPLGWAAATAELLGRLNYLASTVSRDVEARRLVDVDDTAAWVVLPLLELVAGRTVGSPQVPRAWGEDLHAAEEALARVVLTISLRLTGRPPSEALLTEVLAALRGQPPAAGVAQARAALLAYHRRTPVRYPPLEETAQKAAAAAGKFIEGMDYVQTLTDQWSHVNALAFESRRLHGRRVLGLEFDVRPGQQVAFRNLGFFAPEVFFTGHGRVEIRPEMPGEPGTVVLFYAEGGPGIQLQFDGLVYALVRLLAFPLDDAALREVRYRPARGCQGAVVEVLMEALEGEGDARRLFRVETGSKPVLEPRPDLPPRLAGRTRTTVFHFYNGLKHWHYTRTSFKKPELWQGR